MFPGVLPSGRINCSRIAISTICLQLSGCDDRASTRIAASRNPIGPICFGLIPVPSRLARKKFYHLSSNHSISVNLAGQVEPAVSTTQYRIHGDNIVECERAFSYVVLAIGSLARTVTGPIGIVTCPSYEIELHSADKLNFTFLPGYGDRRWNQDIAAYVKSAGGRLREAADAIVTVVDGPAERPLFAMEFCGALPAGNNAWQRHGRAFSFAHAGIPYFYVAELGGYELTQDRERKAERWPNPAIPFSFFSMTHYQGSVCLPVYEPNSGARAETVSYYGPIFGKNDFLEYIRLVISNSAPTRAAQRLGEKCVGLVELLASARTRQDTLNTGQWEEARRAVEGGEGLTGYLAARAPLVWRKRASIGSLTASARAFMNFGATISLGLTSTSLPLSFVPRDRRRAFAAGVRRVYPDVDVAVTTWLGAITTDLAIAWVAGFKPKGEDSRPDRGLTPLARMLIGDGVHLLTFIYGPAPAAHWRLLTRSTSQLIASNGLWEAVLGVSDAVLLDTGTMVEGTPRALLRQAWASSFPRTAQTLNVTPRVLSVSEQDVDTALHVILSSLGSDLVFEGMCNPPGGDWSGVSFIWSRESGEYRWLTLPRVTARGEKRPDHVFGLFGLGDVAACLCIESKERSSDLEADIGPRLISYTEKLFAGAPSIWRRHAAEAWAHHSGDWGPRSTDFVSMGAFVANSRAPFAGVPSNTGLDIICGFSFSDTAAKCVAHVRALTDKGRGMLDHIVAAGSDNPFGDFRLS